MYTYTVNLYFQRFKKASLFLYMLLPLLAFALLSAKLLKSCTRVANNHVCSLQQISAFVCMANSLKSLPKKLFRETTWAFFLNVSTNILGAYKKHFVSK